MSFIQAAFDAVCADAQTPETFYVCLVESCQCYGGPEEGGWYYQDNNLVAFQGFSTEELATAAADKIKALAEELQNQSRREYGEHCLRQMEWLEARGLDADYFPEDDGPSEYRVFVSDEIPQYSHARPHYE
jgi:hypothetical protein